MSFIPISLLLVSVLNLPGAETAQLAILVQQSAQQLEQIKEIVKNSKSQSEDFHRAVELANKLTQGIDSALKPFSRSNEFQKAIIAVQQSQDYKSTHYAPDVARDYMQIYQEYFPRQAKENKEDYQSYKEFQKQVVQANSADLTDLDRMQKEIASAPPAQLPKLAADANSKTWASNVRISVQLTELIKEMRALREEIFSQRVKEEAKEKQREQYLNDAMSNDLPRGSEK